MNITDVDDKTIRGANNEGISLTEYTRRYEKAFFEDLETLNIDKADIFPRATEHIPEMVEIIKNLLSKNIAYKAKDGIYFDISEFNSYGKLSHTKLEELQGGKRVKQDQYSKEEAQDFALWKFWDEDDGKVFWETELGKGRPGWHIECSAMSMKYLGESFDMHAGGIDLIFPHHENEIAQSEGSTKKTFVRYWFHNEHLLVNGQKMSKSLGNFYTLRDLLSKGYNPKAIRYLLLSANYRMQLNFTEEAVKASENAVQRLQDFVIKLKSIKHKNNEAKDKGDKGIKELIEEARKSFEREMDDDLNISNALAVIFDFVKKANILIMENKVSGKDADDAHSLMLELDKVLGILEKKDEEIPSEIKKIIDEREKARMEKDFKKADKIRNELKEKGYILEDTKDGVIAKRDK